MLARERSGGGCTNTPVPRSTTGAMCGGVCGRPVGAPGRALTAAGATAGGAGSGARGRSAGQDPHPASARAAAASQPSRTTLNLKGIAL